MPDIQLITAGNASLETRFGVFLKPNKSWNIRASPVVDRSRNKIRNTLNSITSCPPLTAKAPINLGLGDPTFYPLHPPPSAAVTAVKAVLEEETSNGYLPGVGSIEARQAVADYHERWDGVKYGVDDIVLTHGVGQGLDLIFSILLTRDSNILLPRPGFAQYTTLLANIGTEVRFYDCLGENDWEADLDMLDSLCDERTGAIMVTNPSNPCGSNYSQDHLEAILAIAEKRKIPIIADEIYGHMTWKDPFIPLASVSTSVPVITLSGLSKRFLLPGWRFGWAALHDPLRVAGVVRDGMAVWGNRFMGPNSLLQAALPAILGTPAEWFDEVLAKVRTNAEIMYEAITSIPGLSCSVPSGALYMLVHIDPLSFPHIADDITFSTALHREEAVFVLPGICFEAEGYFRVVIASPEEVMRDVAGRLRQFCERHRVV